MKMYSVYIIYSPAADRYYIGQTENLFHRLKRHNDGLVKSTKAYLPWELKYHENYDRRAEAMRREHEIKRQKKRSYLES
jgi:putative endonuclease